MVREQPHITPDHGQLLNCDKGRVRGFFQHKSETLDFTSWVRKVTLPKMSDLQPGTCSLFKVLNYQVAPVRKAGR